MSLSPEVAFERYRERVLSVIYLRMGPDLRTRMDPEDVLQEVAIEAINSWHTLSDPANAGAWLVTLARRKVARILRDQVGVAARDPRRERDIKTDFPVADRRSGPVTLADRKDRLGLLEAALERLSEDHREVILLSRNSADTGLRVFNSIKHYELDTSVLAKDITTALDRIEAMVSGR